MFPLQNVITKKQTKQRMFASQLGCILWLKNKIKLYKTSIYLFLSLFRSCNNLHVYQQLLSKGVNILVLSFVFVSFLFNLRCILNVLLPAYVLFLSLKKKKEQEGKKIKFKNIFVVKNKHILFIYLFNNMTKQPCNVVKIKHCSGTTAYRKINLPFQCSVSFNSTVSWFFEHKIKKSELIQTFKRRTEIPVVHSIMVRNLSECLC